MSQVYRDVMPSSMCVVLSGPLLASSLPLTTLTLELGIDFASSPIVWRSGRITVLQMTPMGLHLHESAPGIPKKRMEEDCTSLDQIF